MYVCWQGWGNPMRFLQVSNFSSRCLVEVNWVDEDGALVSRSVLKPGRKFHIHTLLSHYTEYNTPFLGTHVERCGPDHVWLISAIPFKSTIGAGYSTVAGSVGSAGTMGSSQTSLDFLQEEYMSEGAASGHSAAVMLFKPSNTALQHDRFASFSPCMMMMMMVMYIVTSSLLEIGAHLLYGLRDILCR